MAQKLLRHSDYRTTLRHYTQLGIADTARALAQIPAVGNPDSAASSAG